MFIAVLDSCVLWPSTLRDFLLSLAIEQLYTPAWSSAILEEVQYNEAEKLKGRLPYLTVEEADMRAAHLVTNMQSAFPDALTTGWEPLEGSFGLPDIDDEHGPALSEDTLLDILENRYRLTDAVSLLNEARAT